MSREKQIDIIRDLLVEFDEMGFVPSTAVPDHEAYAIKWRAEITKALADYFKQSEWISVDERLPEVETEVLVLAVRKYKTKEGLEIPIITTAMYEDGTMPKDDSCWSWVDVSFTYDEENDIEYLPEGWWEYSHYNDDNECGAVSDKVTHWMPLPEAPKMKGGAE